MSATLEGALKAEIEAGGHGIMVYNREAPGQVLVNGIPTPPSLPYAVCTGLDIVAERTGDSDMQRARELIQVDVYQDVDNVDPFLAKNVFKQLRKARLVTAPEYVFRVQDLTLIPNSDPTIPEIVRHTITGLVRRRM